LQRTREKLYKKYQGTRLGKQELGGQILEDVPGAVATVDQLAVARRSEHPSLSKRIVMIDPSQTNTETSDDTGITVQGRAGDEVYLLADLTMKGDVSEWVDVAVEGAVRWECPEIHYEAPWWVEHLPRRDQGRHRSVQRTTADGLGGRVRREGKGTPEKPPTNDARQRLSTHSKN
jgi:hypothetical protein